MENVNFILLVSFLQGTENNLLPRESEITCATTGTRDQPCPTMGRPVSQQTEQDIDEQGERRVGRNYRCGRCLSLQLEGGVGYSKEFKIKDVSFLASPTK